MVDRLKQSLEQLEPPVCPNCHIDMSWYRSALMSESPVTIAHLFTCSNCGGTAETQIVDAEGRRSAAKTVRTSIEAARGVIAEHVALRTGWWSASASREATP